MKTVMTSAAFRPLGMIGKVDPEEEEDELTASQEDGPPSGLASETGFDERKRTFEYLKEYRKQKRLNEKLECLKQAREETHAEVNRMLREDAERVEISEAATENAGIGISYVENESGKLVKRRPSARRKTPARRRAPIPFTPEDRERIDRTCDRRHTLAWYRRLLLGVAEGNLVMTRAQRQALLAFGRSKGWHRKPGKR